MGHPVHSQLTLLTVKTIRCSDTESHLVLTEILFLIAIPMVSLKAILYIHLITQPRAHHFDHLSTDAHRVQDGLACVEPKAGASSRRHQLRPSRLGLRRGQKPLVSALWLHSVCFNWDRLIGTISKFWEHVCLFVCMSFCVYVGKLGH